MKHRAPAAVLLRLFALFWLSISLGCSTAEKGTLEEETGSPDEAASNIEDNKEGATVPSSKAEEELVEKALDAYDRDLLTLAKETFDELRNTYPGSYYSPLAELKIADCNFFLSDPAAALVGYEEFLRLHPQHEAAPYVKYQIGNTYRSQYRGVKHDQAPLRSAIKAYERLLKENPDSRFVPLAQKWILLSKEKLAAHEAYVAEFYLKQGKTKASAERYRELTGKYGTTEAAERAQETVGSSEDIQDYITTSRKGIITKGDKRATSKEYAQSSRGGLLSELKCEYIDEKAIFSLTFSEAVKLEKTSEKTTSSLAEKEAKVLVLEAIADSKKPRSSLQKSRNELSCAAGAASIRASRKKDSPSSVQLELLLPAEKEANFITLDRPNRVVIVIE